MNNVVWEVWMDFGMKAKAITTALKAGVFLCLKENGPGNLQTAMSWKWLVVPGASQLCPFLLNTAFSVHIGSLKSAGVFTV